MKSFILLGSFLLISSVSSQFPELKVIVTKGNQSESLLLSTLDTTLAASSLHNPSLKTVIYFFGYTSSYAGDPSVKELQNAFDALGGYNFFVGDWSTYNKQHYLTVLGNVNGIAAVYGQKFADMITAGKIDLANWHFIGQSLGAHMAGAVARKIKSTSTATKYVVRRVTGLDPAGPLIYPNNAVLIILPGFKPLVSTDAAFVDVIHTDRANAGTSYKIGHVDFWPNNGTAPMPGCPPLLPVTLSHLISSRFPPDNYCSHIRSIKFFAESVAANPNKNAFRAAKCSAPQSVITGHKCSALSTTTFNYMGLYATKTPSGNFFLEVNAASPYNVGQQAVKPAAQLFGISEGIMINSNSDLITDDVAAEEGEKDTVFETNDEKYQSPTSIEDTDVSCVNINGKNVCFNNHLSSDNVIQLDEADIKRDNDLSERTLNKWSSEEQYMEYMSDECE